MAALRILIILIVGVPSVIWIATYGPRLWAECRTVGSEGGASACTRLASGWLTSKRGRGSANFNIAIQRQEAGDFEGAIAAYGVSIEHAIASKDERIAENYYGRAWNFGKLGRRQEAIDDYTKAIEIDPNYYSAYFNRAIEYKQLEMYDAAATDNRQAIRIKPASANAHYNLASVLDAQDRRDEAIGAFTRAIELNPKDPDGYRRRGYLYFGGPHRDLDKALADFDRAIALNKRDATLFWYRASVRRQKDDLRGAIADLDAAIAIDPNDQRSYYDRALAYRALGDGLREARDIASANNLPGSWRLSP
jgi:tetratricopeptide (TPR) repeat protein